MNAVTAFLHQNLPSTPDGSRCVSLLHTRSTQELRDSLRQCQQRLGTAHELAGDMDQARALAHALNNRLQAEYLQLVVRGAA